MPMEVNLAIIDYTVNSMNNLRGTARDVEDLENKVYCLPPTGGNSESGFSAILLRPPTGMPSSSRSSNWFNRKAMPLGKIAT